MTLSLPIKPEDIFSLLSCKNGMKEERYFVRRKELMAKLIGDISDDNHTSIWIFGARRIGKTSIANAISRFCSEKNYLSLYIDAIDFYQNGVQSVMEKSIKLVKKTISLQGETLKEQFESLAKSSKSRPVLIVIDEFDKVALNMGEVNQAFFRRLDSEFNEFSFMFISYQSPTNIVEEVEINSRLLGVCDIHKIKAFNRVEVKSLFKKVKTDLGINEFGNYAENVFSCIGGLPVTVIAACKELAIARYHRGELTDNDIKDILESSKKSFEHELRSYWSYLNPFTRSVLLGKSEPSEYKSFLKEDGLFVNGVGAIKPSFLIEVGEKTNSIVSQENNKNSPGAIYQTTINIFRLVSEINQSLHLRKFANGFKIDNISIQMYQLCQHPYSGEELKSSVSYLYQVFFEGARTDKGEKKYRLPSLFGDMYKKSKVIGDISNLRNFFDHNQTRSTDSDKPNKYYKKASEIFERRCGKVEPATEELRMKVRTSLLDDLLELLNTIYTEIQNCKLTP